MLFRRKARLSHQQWHTKNIGQVQAGHLSVTLLEHLILQLGAHHTLTWYSAHLLTVSWRPPRRVMQVRWSQYYPLDNTKLNEDNWIPVERTTKKQVQGVANTQKRRLRNGASSSEGKCNGQNWTERLSAFCSQMGCFSCTWEGDRSCFDLSVVHIDKYKTCGNKCSFQVFPESRHAAGEA